MYANLCYYKSMKIFLAFIALLLLSLSAEAKHLYLEKEYQEQWCNSQLNCISEYELSDKTRVDCLTPTHAIEFDFGKKWAEAIGQSLYYALKTNRKPGVVLILEDKNKEQKYLNRLQEVAKRYGIDVWVMSPKSMPVR